MIWWADAWSFDLRFSHIWWFDIWWFDFIWFNVLCIDVSCFDVKCFDVKCFDVKCFDVKCFDVKCFDVQCFDLSWICIIGKLREVKATPHPSYITVDNSIFLLTWLDLPFNQLNFQVFVTTDRQSKRKKLSNRKTFLNFGGKKLCVNYLGDCFSLSDFN